ncbi:hypothetical protein HBN54_003416 [Hymenobacter sp. 1B]|uniref:Uncharacterized protein n=1 Tax=Hymenobacter artigasi TaxID=2719616 RepID=A0ABX1HP97_9BACT|nr:hypothetical protein [Hymenobacter artigasi]
MEAVCRLLLWACTRTDSSARACGRQNVATGQITPPDRDVTVALAPQIGNALLKRRLLHPGRSPNREQAIGFFTDSRFLLA